MPDMDIYVDNLAGIQFRNINRMIEQARIRLQNNGFPDSDHYMKTLETSSISEDNYFNNLLGNDIVKIARDIRAAHRKDSETGEGNWPRQREKITQDRRACPGSIPQTLFKIEKSHSYLPIGRYRSAPLVTKG